MKARLWLLACLLTLAPFACGHNSGSNTDGGNGGDGNGTIDAGFGADAPFGGACTPGAAQCSNCIDDDMDGKIDGFDPECTGPLDNDESSFKTGIPGDNIDATSQDCFFDGNSGSGNDGCDQHTCCLLQAPDKQTCHAEAPLANENKYDIAKCYVPWGQTPVPQKCIDVCGKLAPPGCDCFGCCTVCNSTGCYSVDINPAVSPNCDSTNLQDPTACKRCVPSTSCGSPTCNGNDPASCVLCPGQDPSTLPPSCSGMSACPTGITACDAGGNCAAGTYCSNGCCIGTIL